MNYKVIASGSAGNCVIYHNTIAVDMGVPFSLLKPFINDLQIVLLTHQHLDHLNTNTLLTLSQNRPTLRFGCCEWLVNQLPKLRNLDIYEIGKIYDYEIFQISPIKLYHDISNCGYRIFKDNYKILHATDTGHLDGITAKEYDLYALEHNYNEDTVFNSIAQKEDNEEFAYQTLAMKTHLSEQQARKFVFENKGINYEVLRLHESKIT
jgi:L-ascorbate metabolism protein UlaG (beta-lactamase superfamily)